MTHRQSITILFKQLTMKRMLMLVALAALAMAEEAETTTKDCIGIIPPTGEPCPSSPSQVGILLDKLNKLIIIKLNENMLSNSSLNISPFAVLCVPRP